MDVYNAKRDKVVASLRALQQVATELKLASVAKKASDNLELMQEEKFNLVVVGEFSRGKSTFVNAMLGHKILPASKRPTTAIISKIVYSDQPTYTLHYRDEGRPPQAVSEENFLELVAPREESLLDKIRLQLSQEKQAELDSISYASIGYPLEFCRENVEVVDTPGTNDLNTGRIEITYRYLNHADAVILVLSALQALSATELEFLEERILGNQIRDIFFVVNFRDRLNGAESEQQVLDYIVNVLHEKLPELPSDLKIYMVSSLQTLLYRRQAAGEVLKPKQLLNCPASLAGTGFVEFEQDLAEFLSLEKGQGKLRKYQDRGRAIAGQLIDDIDDRLALLATSADEIRTTIGVLEQKLATTTRELESIQSELRAGLKTAEYRVANTCDEALVAMRSSGLAAIEDCSEVSREAMERAMQRALDMEQKKFLHDIEQLEQEIITSELNKAHKKLQRLMADVGTVYSSRQSVDVGRISKINTSFNLGSLFENDSDDHIVLGAGIGAYAGAILLGPIGFFAGGILGAMMGEKKAPTQAELKSSIRGKLTERINSSSASLKSSTITSYQRQTAELVAEIGRSVSGRLADMQSQLKEALAEKESTEQSAEQKRTELEKKLTQTKALFTSFSEI